MFYVMTGSVIMFGNCPTNIACFFVFSDTPLLSPHVTLPVCQSVGRLAVTLFKAFQPITTAVMLDTSAEMVLHVNTTFKFCFPN